MSTVIERLEKMNERYQEINDLMMSSDVLGDRKKMAKLGKEQNALTPIVEAYEEYKKVLEGKEEAQMLLEDEDADVRELAKEELSELSEKEQALLDRIEVLLIPKDPTDDCNAIMEIRGAIGGDEANIFAGDLYRMYTRWAETKGFKIEVTEAYPMEMGGFSQVSFIVKGDGAYGILKFESGGHRVQRVPKTESQGRLQTSIATVLVMPQIDEEIFEIDPKDLEIETMRSSGAGGQHINKTDSAVRITHIPTGISVKCQDGRSQHENRATAMMHIRAKVFEMKREQEEAQKGAERKLKIGSGDRSDKIRTYNYPQNRVTDHRIGLTIQQLDRIIDGDLDGILTALQEQDQKDKIAGNA